MTIRLISCRVGSSKLDCQSWNAFGPFSGLMRSVAERLLPPAAPSARLICAAEGSTMLFFAFLPLAPTLGNLGCGRVLTYTSPAGHRPVQLFGGGALGRKAGGGGGEPDTFVCDASGSWKLTELCELVIRLVPSRLPGKRLRECKPERGGSSDSCAALQFCSSSSDICANGSN